MFRRLRTKLVVACLLLSTVTLIPVALWPYYTLQQESYESNNEKLLAAETEISKLWDLTRENLGELVHEARGIIEERLASEVYDPQAVASNDKEALDQINLKAQTEVRRFLRLNHQQELSILGMTDYAQWQGNIESVEKPGFLQLPDGSLRAWAHGPLVHDEHKIGGVFVTQRFFEASDSLLGGGASGTAEPSDQEQAVLPDAYTARWQLNSPVRVDVVSVNNEDFRASMAAMPESMEQGLLAGQRVIANAMELNERPVQARLIPFNDHHGNLVGVVILSAPRIGTLWGYTKKYTLLSLALSVLLAVLLGALVARSIASPLNRLAKTAKKMAEGDLAARVHVTGADEIAVLSRVYNDMADRVEGDHKELERRAVDLQESYRLMEVANHELHRTQEFLENILANIRSGVIALDMSGRVVRLNRAAVEILGVTRADVGRHYHELLGRNTFSQLIESALHNGVSIFQREVQHSNIAAVVVPLQVSTVPLLDQGRLTSIVVTFHDLSNVRRLEEQLVRQDRLAALGRLSAGVAHEIRNPLGIMKGSAELLKRRFGGLPGEEGLTDFILDEVSRLSRVVSDFLNFARPPAPELQRREVNEIVRRATMFLEHQDTPAPIEYCFNLDEHLPPVSLDSSLFQQVMLNILLNAQESMPKGGTITVQTALTPSGEIAIEIIDEGTGIEPDAIDNIFDPFFSSKETGTGLGLSVVHQVVVGHDGRIEVDSTPDKGSTFRVILPAFIEELAPIVPSGSEATAGVLSSRE